MRDFHSFNDFICRYLVGGQVRATSHRFVMEGTDFERLPPRANRISLTVSCSAATSVGIYFGDDVRVDDTFVVIRGDSPTVFSWIDYPGVIGESIHIVIDESFGNNTIWVMDTYIDSTFSDPGVTQ